MSFGFSIGDLVALIALTKKTYDGWRDAPREYEDVVQTLSESNMLLSHVERRFDTLMGSETNAGKQEEIGEISRSCEGTISELRSVIKRRRRLGHWDRLRLGAGASHVNDCKNRLARHLNILTPFLFSLELESIGKDMSSLPATLDRLPHMLSNALPAALGKMIDQRIDDSQTVRGSITTTYGEDDDRQAYRELRRNLRFFGIKDSVVRQERSKLVEFIKSLTHNGHDTVLDAADGNRQSSKERTVPSSATSVLVSQAVHAAKDADTVCAKDVSTAPCSRYQAYAETEDEDEFTKSERTVPGNDKTSKTPAKAGRYTGDSEHHTHVGYNFEDIVRNKPEGRKADLIPTCVESTTCATGRRKYQAYAETEDEDVVPKIAPRTRSTNTKRTESNDSPSSSSSSPVPDAETPTARPASPPPYNLIKYEPLDVNKEGLLTIQLHMPAGFSVYIKGGRLAKFHDRCAPSTGREHVRSLPQNEYHLLPKCLHGFPSGPMKGRMCDCQVVHWTPELQRWNPRFVDGLRRWVMDEGV